MYNRSYLGKGLSFGNIGASLGGTMKPYIAFLKGGGTQT